MKLALLISTYNWPEALDVVLKSLERQTALPDEILIADDGSGPETKAIINKYKDKFPVPLNHFWQEDKGFRKSEILNKALASTSAEYIVQIDGDCILHRDFMKDHMALAAPGMFLYGSRINIKPNAVSKVLKNQTSYFSLFSGSIKNRTRNLRIPFFQNFYKEKNLFSKKVRGCNISYWRKDLIAVNGYNEEIKGWGREDSELVLRMLNTGVKGKRLRYGGILYHLYHPEKSKDNLSRNHKVQELTIRENRTWCEDGIDKYLKESA